MVLRVPHYDEPAPEIEPQDPPPNPLASTPQDPPAPRLTGEDRGLLQEAFARTSAADTAAHDRWLMQQHRIALEDSPDEFARALQIGRDLGLAADTVAKSREVAQRMRDERAFRERDLLKRNPMLAEVLGHLPLMRVARDDLDVLSRTDSLLGEMSLGIERAILQRDLGVLGAKAIAGQDDDEDRRAVERLRRRLSVFPETKGFLPNAAEIASQVVHSIPVALAAGASGAGVGAIAGPKGAAAGFGYGFGAAMFGQSAAVEAGNMYFDLIEQGFPPYVARRASIAGGIAIGALDVVGVGIVGKPFKHALAAAMRRELAGKVAGDLARPGAGQILRDYAMGVAGETTTESLQEVVAIVTERLAREAIEDPELRGLIKTQQDREDLVARVLAVAEKTAQGMAILGAPGPILRQQVESQRAAQAAAMADKIRNLAGAFGESKTRGRDAASHDEIVAGLAERHGVPEFFVEAAKLDEALQQSGISREHFAEKVPEVAAQLAEAVELNADVVIRTERLAAVAEVLGDKLEPHLRTDPDGMSLAEAESFQQPEKEKGVEDLAKQVEEEAKKSQAFQLSATAVERAIREQLIAAGRPAVEAGHDAKLWRAFVETQAARLGMSPEEFVNLKAPLRVEGSDRQPDKYDTVPFQPGLEQPGKSVTDSPEFRAWFGESKVVDEKGAPLRVFHGTNPEISRRDVPQKFHIPSWFTTSPEEAGGYAGVRAGGSFIPPSVTKGGSMVPAFLSLKNPAKVTAEEARYATSGLIERLKAAGHDGLVVDLPANPLLGRPAARHYVPFAASQIKSATGNRGTFDPNDPNILRSGARGHFEPGKMLVRLASSADASTFLHEGGHVFLHIYAALAAEPNAHPLIKRDFQAFLDWRGIKDVETWHAMSLEQQRKHHEAFANNFELYLYDNEAPTPELRTLFQRFKAWLGKVYEMLVSQRIRAAYRKEFGEDLPELTPAVRQVMDRMLASEAAAARAERVRGIIPAFETEAEASAVGVDWQEYQERLERQRAALGDELTKDNLRTLAWLDNQRKGRLRALQREKKDERKAIRDEVAQQVRAEPVFRAREWLRTGHVPAEDGSFVQGNKDSNHRLSTDAVRAILGAEADRLKSATSQQGVRPDDVAPAFGFRTGEEMVKALAATPKFDEVVDVRTDERVLAGQADVQDVVNRSVATEAMARFAADEFRAITRSTVPVRETMQAARAAAQRLVNRKPLRELRPAAFAAAERRAAGETRTLIRKGDTVGAGRAKFRELVNKYLVTESRKAIAEWEAAKRKFRDLQRPDDRLAKSRDVNLVGAARAILAAYGLGPGPKQAHAHLEKVAEYDPDLFAEIKPMVDRATVTARDHRTMAFAELRDLRDSVLSLWERSLRERMVEFAGKKESRDEVEAKLLAAFERFGVPEETARRRPLTEGEKKQRSLGSLKAGLRHPESWTLEVDGGRHGDVHRYLFDMIRKAFDAYMVEKNRKVKALHDLVSKSDWRGPKVHARELDYTFGSREQLIGFLLHLGNPSNLRKNSVGRGWAEDRADGTIDAHRVWDFVHRAVREGALTKKDFDTVQAVWDLYESTKADAQKAFFENYGYYFDEVEAQPFTVRWPDGTATTYRGGYVPAKPDLDLVAPQPGQVTADGITEIAKSVAESRPSTGKGFTITRTDITRPLEMSLLRQVFNLDEELRFIHLQRPGRDIDALLRRPRIRNTINRIDPNALVEMFQPWLADTMRNRVMAPGGNPTWNKLLVMLRRNTAIAYMFGNVANAAQQVTGLATSALYVPVRHLRAAASLFLRERGKLVARIIEQSDFMRLRLEQQIGQLVDDVDVVLDPTWLGNAQAWTQRHAFFLQRLFQNPVDIITWQGAFERAVADGKAEADAVRDADSAVRLSQSSGTAPDLSKFERGSALGRTMTQFGSFWIATFNTLAQRHGAERAKAAAVAVLLVGVLAGGIKKALEGGWDDEDEDGAYWDDVGAWAFGEAVQTAAAAGAPVVGPAIARHLMGESAGRLSFGASMGAVESAANAVTGMVRVWTDPEKDLAGRNVRDVATLFSLLLGLPLTLPAKPASFLVDVGADEVVPTSTIDYIRGLLTGRASPASKR